jgi:hypothetical protein
MSNDTPRATFESRYQQRAGIEFDPDKLGQPAAMQDAIHAAIQAEAYRLNLDPAKDYQKATRSFFSRCPDVHAAYLATETPFRR